MGYSYRFNPNEVIEVTPPIDYTELRALTQAGCTGHTRNANIIIETTDAIEDGARVSRITRAVIVGRQDVTRDPSDDLLEIASLLPGHTFVGHLRGTGEAGDHMRWRIVSDRSVMAEEAKLIWPDGTTEEIRT